VLDAGLRLVDEQGLAAVTMQAVADRLGVTPMALYRHVTNKADLLDGLVESTLLEVPLPDPNDPWRDRLAATARGIRIAALRHPGVFPLLLQRAAATPGARRTRDVVCTALRQAGLSEGDAAQLERLVSTAILGFAASEAGGRFAALSPEQLDADFARLQDMVAGAVLGALAATTP
jgi:AcrR family transcriptional regulator